MAKKDAKAVTEAVEDEDHISAFHRRLDRLQAIAEEAEFESGTLLGDLRDGLLEVFKHREKAWAAMSQQEQRDTAKMLENIARTFLRKAVVVVAEEDLPSVRATLKGYSVKGDVFSLKAEARGGEDEALQLFHLDGHDVVIMSASASRFESQRKDVETDPDQPALGFSDPPPAGAENDEDLVDAATSTSEDEEAEADSEVVPADA